MTRTFWIAVGAIGGITAYRRGTRAVTRARELGPLGTAQVAAQATSTLAGRTANGLGRLRDLRARRDGRLVIGSAQDATATATGAPVPGARTPAAGGVGVPAGWVPATDAAGGPAGRGGA